MPVSTPETRKSRTVAGIRRSINACISLMITNYYNNPTALKELRKEVQKAVKHLETTLNCK